VNGKVYKYRLSVHPLFLPKRKKYGILSYMKAIQNLTQLKRFLKSQRDIGFAYLYGSAVRGVFNKESDIDIAVYLKGNSNQFFNRRIELCDKLSKITKRETNVVVLNQLSSLFLKFVILQEGALLCDNDHGLRLDYEPKTLNLYYDYAPFLEAYNNKYLEKNL